MLLLLLLTLMLGLLLRPTLTLRLHHDLPDV